MMSESKEELNGLPDLYLSPTRALKLKENDFLALSDSEQQSVLDDMDSEVWTFLSPEITVTERTVQDETLSDENFQGINIGQREEVEGDSSVDSSLNKNNFPVGRPLTMSYPREPEGSGENDAEISQKSIDTNVRQSSRSIKAKKGQWKHKRGETPGSDCPPLAGMGALARVFRQPLDLNTNSQSHKNELVFSPGGDEGFMVPGGVSAYYGTASESDTDDINWNRRSETGASARDVEGADNDESVLQLYGSNRLVTPGVPENMERNSPAGLSTPDAESDLSFRGRTVFNRTRTKNSIRPPVVGQSEEQIQTTRKDLGSTDGEESEDEGQKRAVLLRDTMEQLPNDIQLSSLGSQSENTDSVNTVLDMSRGEVQGCETDETIDTPVLSPLQVTESSTIQFGPKPTFVVGGPLAPRCKYSVFQSTVRGRMQDMMASLELEPKDDARVYVNRDRFLSQPPLCPPVAPVSEQEVSLASMVSVESTHHPESSDRVTSPSVLSVSSAASSKRLEWDSGADVGYLGNTPEQITSSLSTLERIALGSYASVLRTEPEGTTYVADRQRPSKKSKGSSTRNLGSFPFSRRSNVEEASASLSTKPHRGQHPRDKVKMSSSEEDFSGRLSSQGNSPRRRLRRRAASSSKKLDLPARSAMRTKKTFGRLQEILQELNSEGKTSSLVELNQASRQIPECRRSNSQQSLTYPGDLRCKHSELVSSISVAAGSSASVSTTVGRCVRAESDAPCSDLSVCPINDTPMGATKNFKSADCKVPKVKNSAGASRAVSKSTSIQTQHASCISSGNEISSKSRSSDTETLSDIKDTDGDSCPSSSLVSDEEPANLKARKNSENARNHENIVKQHLRRGKEKPSHCNWQRKTDDSSSSSSLQRSLLESQVSLQATNNSLQALSVKLREKIQALLDSGTMKKVQDYNKLQDYVAFIGLPSADEEECRLKQGVASVIMRMFGEMGTDDTDVSNTMHSDTSDPVTSSSQSDSKAESMSINTILSNDEPDVLHIGEHAFGDGGKKHHDLKSGEASSTSENVRSITPNGTVKIVPYRPPSATRTYFMAVSCSLEEGEVEAERGTTPSDEASLAMALTARQDDLRGQAEGQGEARDDASDLSSPSSYQYEARESEHEGTSELRNGQGKEHRSKDWEDEESGLSGAMDLPQQWSSAIRPQISNIVLPGTISSDESSQISEGHPYDLEMLSKSRQNIVSGKQGNLSSWKYSTTRSESLYKDKLGTLHVAKQPPGYTDDRDSHQSESMSDHEPHRPRTNDTESQEDGRMYAHPWTSSGSESAYETIRERHRHVDEALASSFEFYSTSPRDARLLGYVSSEGEKVQENERGDLNLEEAVEPEKVSEPSPLKPQPSHSRDYSLQRQNISKKPALYKESGEGSRFISSFSSHTEENDLSSSQISFVQLRKHRYVRRIQHYIDSLEKLERALVGPFGESIGSENSIQRYVTEGRSHTESDSNRDQTRNILGQSETASSSLASSDLSDSGTKRKSHHPRWRRKGVLSRSDAQSGSQDDHLLSRRSNDGSIHGGVVPVQQSSLASSPRVNLSHRSSDLTNSRTSTLKQIEKEVRMLAHAQEKSRHLISKNMKSRSTIGRKGHQYDMQRMYREEPHGEEDPSRSGFTSQRGTLDSNLSSKYSPPEQLLSRKGSVRSKTEKIRMIPASNLVSEEDTVNGEISDDQISRRGDGRETGDNTKQIGKSTLAAFGSSNRYRQNDKAVSLVVRDASVSATLPPQLWHKDFGQMFPSTDSIRSSSPHTQNIGIQTGVSLLGIDDRRTEETYDTLKSNTSSSSRRQQEQLISGSLQRIKSKKTGLIVNDVSSQRKEHLPNARSNSSKEHTTVKVMKERGIGIPSSGDYDSIPNGDERERTTVRHDRINLPDPQELPEKDEPKGKKEIWSSQTSSLRQSDLPTHDHLRVIVPKLAVVKHSEQNVVNLDVVNSVPSSVRSLKSTDIKSSIQKSCQNGGTYQNSEHSSESDKGSPNENSNQDSGVAENGYTRSEISESETRDFEQSKPGCARSSDSQTSKLSESGRTCASSIGLSRHGNHYAKEQGSYSGGIIQESSIAENILVNENMADQHQIYSETIVPEVYLNSRNDDAAVVQSFEERHSPPSENDLIRNAKNKLLQMYSRQLIPYRNSPDESSLRNDSIGTGRECIHETEDIRNVPSNRINNQHVHVKGSVAFEISMENKENFKSQPKSKVIHMQEKRKLPANTTKKNITLQEALSKARPDYMQKAGDRRNLIRLKQEMRQVAQCRNHEIISQLPTNLQTPSTLQRFLYKPDIAPLFSYKNIREQNKRLYNLLPEANVHQMNANRAASNRANRLIANMYSKKLRNKVLKGRVSHAHKDIVTPISKHRK